MNAHADLAVIQGDYADVKRVRTRKVLQLIIEVPLENEGEVQKRLGPPSIDSQKLVAVALVGTPPVIEGAPVASIQEKKSCTRAQQAGILCNEQSFWKFLEDYEGRWIIDNADAAAKRVRDHCKVKSRADLNVEPEAAEIWDTMRSSYMAWQRPI